MTDDTEQWRPITGWEGNYSVSDHGRVRSELRSMTKKNRTRRVIHRRILQPGQSYDGAPPFVVLCRGGSMTPARADRLVVAAFIGPLPDGHEVRHIDGNRDNNRLLNLAIVPPFNRLMMPPDRKQGPLTSAEVARVFVALARGDQPRLIAVRHGVRTSTINRIKRGRAWKNRPARVLLAPPATFLPLWTATYPATAFGSMRLKA